MYLRNKHFKCYALKKKKLKSIFLFFELEAPNSSKKCETLGLNPA